MRVITKLSNVNEFNIMTILDWRNQTQLQKFKEFEVEHSVKINVYSLISGEIEDEETIVYTNEKENVIDSTTYVKNLNIFPRKDVKTIFSSFSQYLQDTGRFGVKYAKIQKIEEYAKIVAEKINKDINEKDKNILILGHGENIYIPSRIASDLEEMGKKVEFRTTSLSPIYCDGNIIKDEEVFYDRHNKYHFYNISEAEKYDDVIMLTETPLNIKLSSNCKIYNL
jgi:hypothetical protein